MFILGGIQSDVALVLGVEQERNVSGADAARFLGAAAWIGHEGQDANVAEHVLEDRRRLRRAPS